MQTLSQAKDRKDKILNKLYKRRVEIDFSRKSSLSSHKPIASSLTCCRYCGDIFVDGNQQLLTCRAATPSIDYRGRYEQRHASLPIWSLTNHLKALHVHGMTWEAIYWYVWSACVVFQVDDYMVSAWETDKYSLTEDVMILRRKYVKRLPRNMIIDEHFIYRLYDRYSYRGLQIDETAAVVSIGKEQELETGKRIEKYRMKISSSVITCPASITPSLNPLRPVYLLTAEIYDLVATQWKLFQDTTNREIISKVNVITTDSSKLSRDLFDFMGAIWNEKSSERHKDVDIMNAERGRKLSPTMNHASLTRNRSKSKSRIEVDDCASSSAQDRRSRSSSAGRRRKSSSIKTSSSMKTGQKKSLTTSTTTVTVPTVLREMSDEVFQFFSSSQGLAHGIWLHAKLPLQLHPASFHEALRLAYSSAPSLQAVASDTSSSDQAQVQIDYKKLEWILDIIREYDEKRMDAYERFLVSRRSSEGRNFTQQFAHLIDGKTKSQNKTKTKVPAIVIDGEYYRDKGRKPFDRGFS
jgi:hypothetical protein